MDKAVIFIVEGATDKRALENIFKKIYKYKDIHFEFTYGDITSDENIVYSTENISCRNMQKVIDRNKHKREIMDYLLGCDKIKGIPYRCYYLSSNLDHALYNQLNLSDDLKLQYSQAFYEQFMGKETLFIKFLDMEVVNGAPESFPASWRYIRENLHSLQRHTNLNIYFKENPVL